MTQSELYELLKSTGLPVAYGNFSKFPPLPYICFRFSYSRDVIADGANYCEIGNYQIELYSARKDVASEKKIQGVLTAAGLAYSKIESFIHAEKMNQIVYDIKLIGD